MTARTVKMDTLCVLAHKQRTPDPQAGRESFERLGARAQLWDYAHGRDGREVEPSGARKTVGCEINYGVRFDGPADADRFVDELAAQARRDNVG